MKALFVFLMSSLCSCKQPHIVLIVADDYGWGDVGYHGSDIKTPILDRLAAEGVKLDNYYVQPICTPTRSQLLSGRYQIHTGLQHQIIKPKQPNSLPLELPTIADELRELGYSTHMVGKWHLGFYKQECTPPFRGFDSFFGFLNGASDYYKHTKGGYTDLYNNDSIETGYKGVYSTHLFTEKAQRVIEDHDIEKPLFLYLPYQAVHGPIEAPDKYVQQHAHISDPLRRTYAGMVSAMEEGIQNVTETLKQKGMWDDTVLIFTTDNGGHPAKGGSNFPLRGDKSTLWEGGMRAVGFVVSKSLQTTAGHISNKLIHVSDWFPTLIGLAGGHTDGMQLDGHDVWNTISRDDISPRNEILHNIDPLFKTLGSRYPGAEFDSRIRAAIRVGDWKLMTGGIERVETRSQSTQNIRLFNIAKDPFETNELSDKNRGKVEELLGRLADYNRTAVPVVYPDTDNSAHPAVNGGFWQPWL